MGDPVKELVIGFWWRRIDWIECKSMEWATRKVEIEFILEPIKGNFVGKARFGISVDPT